MTSRRVRTVGLSLVCAFIGTSLTGCGVAHKVLGIRDAPKGRPASAVLTADQSKNILTRAFTAAQQGETTTGAAALRAHQTAYTGESLVAADARTKLAAVQPAGAESPLLAPQQPLLLAVSHGFGFPRIIVAQTIPAAGSLPVLHLLTSPNAATPYRITESATMLLATSINPFNPLNKGSSVVTDATGVAANTALLNAYSAAMAFPAKAVKNPPFASDAFSAQIRVRAAATAKAVATQGAFSQVHKMVPSSLHAVRQAGGDSLVFGVVERTDSFKVKPHQAINTSANKAFVLLTGKKKITRRALITTLEFVVFAVSGTTGKAALVAVSEQVVAGSGS